MNQIAAIPTKYKGIQFRSRLEATWARFFDLLELNWTYEPEGFDGWIPDFMIYGDKDHQYVEVKPMLETREALKANARRYEKLTESCNETILLVGREPASGFDFCRTTGNDFLSRSYSSDYCIGYLVDHRFDYLLWADASSIGYSADFANAIPALLLLCTQSKKPTFHCPYTGEEGCLDMTCIHCGGIAREIVPLQNQRCLSHQEHCCKKIASMNVRSLFMQAKNEIQWRKCK